MQRHKAQASIRGRSRSEPAGPTPAPFYPDAAHPNSCLFVLSRPETETELDEDAAVLLPPCRLRGCGGGAGRRATATTPLLGRPAEAGPGVVVVVAAASTHEPSRQGAPTGGRRCGGGGISRRRRRRGREGHTVAAGVPGASWSRLLPQLASLPRLGGFEKNSFARYRRRLASWAGKGA